jgi:GT2 family glycosyltransferase
VSKRRKRSRRAGHNHKPVVDIVMPVYGEPEFLKCCLESLAAYEAGVPYALTLVDDVSPVEMGFVYALAGEMGARVVYHHENKGFAGACNTGARKGRAPWILLLNTDTLITHDGWLKAMVDEGKDPKVGVVGALLTFFPTDHPLYEESPIRPPKRVQHAGVVFDILGRPYHIFSGWSADHPQVWQRREMNCVTGACLMTRRKLWRRLGGLEECYSTGNFEDVEFCIQARLAGYKVVYTPTAHLHHFAGGSNNSTTAKRNARLFQLRMGQVVEFDEWRHW